MTPRSRLRHGDFPVHGGFGAGLVANRGKIISMANKRRLPANYGNQDYMPDGGLIAYAPNIVETWRRLAAHVDKVLKGAKPGDFARANSS
jgi:ABC-type uncharacterized transport system substrate-binding protein